MRDKANISWLGLYGKTFNPWLGCQHAKLPVQRFCDTHFDDHPGCLNCYAQAMSGKFGVQWGPATECGTRRRTADSTWKRVEKWSKKAGFRISSAIELAMAIKLGTAPADAMLPCAMAMLAKDLQRPRVFPSACDPFEDWTSWVDMQTGEQCTMYDVRRDFFSLINRTPNLDWLLLTKRPQNVRTMWIPYLKASALGIEIAFRENVWLLYSSSDQRSLDVGLPHLLDCRDLVPVLGLSLEPLVGPIDLSKALCPHSEGEWLNAVECGHSWSRRIRWVICGGESGPHARPCEVSWIRDIVDQCRAAGVPCFVKQDSGRFPGQQGRIPDDLWNVKEFPREQPIGGYPRSLTNGRT